MTEYTGEVDPLVSFKVAVVGPSRVGKTTLLTAVLNETERLLAGLPVSISVDEVTGRRVRNHRRELQRALEVGEFDAAALGGTQTVNRYRVSLTTRGVEPVDIPFDILDYPGGWLNPNVLAEDPAAAASWPECIQHIEDSVMLLVPIDSAVLMEATTPTQRNAASDLLGLLDVTDMGRRWAKARNDARGRTEPAVLILAPLKCEKYFDDNGGTGRHAGRLRQEVAARYAELTTVVAAETPDRPPVRVVYAPIDTYGCVELMEARWRNVGINVLDFTAHYRFRGQPPKLSVRAAGAVMQELCRCVMAGQESLEASWQAERQSDYDRLVGRRMEAKGFFGTLSYYLSGEASQNREGRERTASEVAAIRRRRADLQDAIEKLAGERNDPRVEIWKG